MIGLAIALGLAAAIAIAYWHLIVAEGAYLGPRVVAWTYDWIAGRYDAVKQFNAGDEDWFVAGPVLRALVGLERPLVLDVATGTGRLPAALLRNHFAPGGQIVGLDLSRGMLRQARSKLRAFGEQQTLLVWHDAGRLPFGDDTFDAVTCLEALEFLEHPRRALAEMVRVLAPGGLLMVTNRVGAGARLLPGRAISRPAFQQVLSGLALQGIETHRWQVDYDLAMARKAGRANGADRTGRDVLALVRCPACDTPLDRAGVSAGCPGCEQSYPIEDGIVALAMDRRGNRQ